MSRINTNIQALMAARVLNQQYAKLSRSLERLSTGLRINSGKDDPAGLVASETLRGEKIAISAAIENARAADNMLAVAEGALQEVSSLLVELAELVGKSANEAALGAEEVQANQLQIDAILESIDRLANTTQFKGRKLLDGSFDYVVSGHDRSQIGAITVNAARIPQGGTRAVVVEVTASAETARLVYRGSSVSGAVTIRLAGNKGAQEFSFASGTAAASIAAAINQSTELTGVSAFVSGTGRRTRIVFNSTSYGSDQFVTIETLSGNFPVAGEDGDVTDYGQDVGASINGRTASTSGLSASVRTGDLDVELILNSGFAQTVGSSSSFVITGGGADFSLAPQISLAGQASIGLGAVDSGSLGNSVSGFLSSLKSGGANDLDSKNFGAAQEILEAATKQVASLRGRLGAFQKHTLQTTINSLQVAYENISAAESAIRDADFALETSNLTRAQILVNAATAMLQLANTLPQNVLALLA